MTQYSLFLHLFSKGNKRSKGNQILGNILSRDPPEPYWFKRERVASRVLIDIVHVLYVVGLCPSLADLVGSKMRSGGDFCPTGGCEIGSLRVYESHILDLVPRKVSGSRRHVHPVYVSSKVSGSRQKDLELSDRTLLRIRRQHRTTDRSSPFERNILNIRSYKTEWSESVLPLVRCHLDEM